MPTLLPEKRLDNLTSYDSSAVETVNGKGLTGEESD